MTLASLSLPVVALALFLTTAWVAAAVLLRLWLGLSGRWISWSRTAIVVAMVPWVAGAAVSLAAVLPGDPHTGQVLACHCLESMPAWWHLCPVHPQEAWVLVPGALGALAALLPGRGSALRALFRMPLGHGGGARPRVVELDRPLALLHGWLWPTLVVDRDLWRSLPSEHRAAIVAHEQGHLRRRDPLSLMVLQLLLVLAPAALAGPVARRWLAWAELRADDEAARIAGDRLQVARALLDCARLGTGSGDIGLAWTGGALEHRVRALLEPPPAARPARPDVGVADLLTLVGLGLAAAAAVPWLHHQLEHVLNLSL